MTAPDPNIGRDILNGQLQILQKIGSGGMGAVYKAAQPAMNRMVAVKILHPKLTSRKDLASRFRREARAMSHLEHPNTVKVLLYGELEDGALYIVMEYLEGRNLNQVVRKEGPLAPERAIPVLVRVCGALQEAHLQGIIHRDLKPENIFLSTNGGFRDYPKVLDFGLAKVTERELRPGSIMLTQEGMVFGTPEFMSPEQAQGKTLDARSDIYSLAVILYEVLTGRLPFEGKAPMEYIQAHVTKPPIALDDRVPGRKFPPGLGAVLARALEKSPQKRYASAAEFAEALRPFAGEAAAGLAAITAAMSSGNAAPGSAGTASTSPQDELPVVAIEPGKPAVPIRAVPRPTPETAQPAQGQGASAGGRPPLAKTLSMSEMSEMHAGPGPNILPSGGQGAALAPGFVATTPQGTVPAGALALAAQKRHQHTILVLAAIAAACLVAGIVITMLILKVIRI